VIRLSRRFRHALSAGAALLAAALPAARAAGQGAGVMVLTVADAATGVPLPNAVVRVDGVWRGNTDGAGRIRVDRLAPGPHRVEVSRLGHHALAPEVAVPAGAGLDLEVLLESDALALRPVVATSTRTAYTARLGGFYERARGGTHGRVILRSQIEARRPARFTDLFDGMAGVRLRPGVHGSTLWLRRFPLPDEVLVAGADTLSRSGQPGECEPLYYVDGVLFPGVVTPDIFPPGEIEGVEVFSGNVPPQFGGSRALCGVIAIWMRDR
jgi:Carboxypeptidase regulatory-like domain